MDFRTRYPDFAPIEQHIRAARVTRAVAVSNAISGFIVDCWNASGSPPPPRRSSSTGAANRAPT